MPSGSCRRGGIDARRSDYGGLCRHFGRVRPLCPPYRPRLYLRSPERGEPGRCRCPVRSYAHVQAPDDETIMERIPQHYMVDDAEEVRNPVGSFCKRLSSTFNFILCGKTPLQRLDMALRRLGIRMLGVFPNGAWRRPKPYSLPMRRRRGWPSWISAEA